MAEYNSTNASPKEPVDLLSMDNKEFVRTTASETETMPSTSNTPYHQMNDEDGSSLRVVSFDMEAMQKNENDDKTDEKDLGYASSIASSALTASGISDPTSYGIVCFIVFMGDMCRGIFFPTQWSLVRSLGGDEVTLGYCVGSFSFGRILVAPLFGRWCVTYGYKKTLMICNSILFAALLLYSQVPIVNKEYFVIFATACLGVGSSNLAITRAFVAEVTATRERTTYIAFLTALQYAGTSVTPFLGSFFIEIFSNEDRVIHSGIFLLNEYTAPAYFMLILVVISFSLLVSYFVDRKRENKKGKKKSARRQELERIANEPVLFGMMTRYDACLLGCMLLNVATKGTIACFETMGIEFAESHFNMHRATAGTIVASSGAVGVLMILSMGKISKFLNDTEMIYGGMSLVVLAIISNTFLSKENENSSWRYAVMILVIYGFGYPVGHTALIGLFSKIVGRQPQGPLQGWFSFSGSLARVCFPILAGYIVRFSSIESLFYFLILIAGSAVAFTYAFRDILTYLSK